MHRRVLVLGDDPRSCLAVVRSLGRRGIGVVLGVQDPQSIVPASRYVTRVVRLPSAHEPVDRWVSTVLEILGKDAFDLLIPTSDDALVPIVRNRTEFGRLVRCAIPDDRGFELTYHKHRTLAMAHQLGVPTPPSVMIADEDELTQFERTPSLALPLIVKPSSSKVWANDEKLDLEVRLVRTWDQLRSRVVELLPLTPVLIQGFVSGLGVGQEFLAANGEILLAFQHERVHEPLGGGGSSYRRSVALDPRLLAWSTAMLRHMRWTGVAMIEFKQDRATGAVALMEINGRFWGSLPLAIASGVDFPYGLYELLVADRLPVPVAYTPGLYARNVLRDMDWFIENRGADRSDPYLLTVPLQRVRHEIGIALRGRERWDTFTLDDPRPGLLELRQAIAPIARRAARAVRRVCSTLTRASYPGRAWQRRRLRRLLTKRPAILLVCKGNICRSPFAERYLRRALIARGLRQIAVASAGFFAEVGRPSPIEACAAAREFGVELDAHRSIRISADLVERAGAILCMDNENANALRSAFPAAASKSFLLGTLRPVPNATIPDPWGSPVEVFSACYRLIVSSLDVVVSSVSDPL